MLLPSLVYVALSLFGDGAGAHDAAAATLLGRLFDPAWNTDNRGVIWTTIIVVLFLSGFGLPMPEDIPLTLSGFTTTKQLGNQFVLTSFVLTFAVVSTPIVLGDLVAYFMGRRFGFSLRERSRLIAKAITDKRLTRVQHWFDEYGNFTVFLGRQVAGIRFVTFYTAGTMKMPLLRFVFFDFLGCLVSVPLWLALGYLTALYGKGWLDVASKRASAVILVGTAVAIVLLVVFARRRKARRRHTGP
ncbi:MAG: DedA family protein [Deltaproteobacteria bacterium]|nr:DedA family protein [Deltaproteobacteria bacterium]